MSVSGYGNDDYTILSGSDAYLGGGTSRRHGRTMEHGMDRVSKNMYVPRILCKIYDFATLTPDIVTRVVLLENHCLYLTTEYILYIKRLGDDISRIVLGEVQDVCNIDGATSNEYIVIKLDGTVIFSKVQSSRSSNGVRKKESIASDDMVVHNTIIYKLPYFDNQVYTTRTTALCDIDREIICVISLHTIYILSIDFRTLHSGGDSLLGIVSFPSPLTYSKIELPVLNDIHLESPPRDEVYNCGIWSSGNHHSLVCSGNGTWLDIWPMHKVDDVWELKRSQYDPIRVCTGLLLTRYITMISTTYWYYFRRA